jgi:hypothetical protein
MSYRASKHNKIQNYEASFKSKVECKHCAYLNKARRSDDQLPTNHWLRDNRDPCKRFLCPVMLATKCTRCSKRGHTEYFCTLSEAAIVEKETCDQERIEMAMDRMSGRIRGAGLKLVSAKVSPVAIATNLFATLHDGSSEDDKVETKVETKVGAKAFANRRNWADAESDDESD